MYGTFGHVTIRENTLRADDRWKDVECIWNRMRLVVVVVVVQVFYICWWNVLCIRLSKGEMGGRYHRDGSLWCMNHYWAATRFLIQFGLSTRSYTCGEGDDDGLLRLTEARTRTFSYESIALKEEDGWGRKGEGFNFGEREDCSKEALRCVRLDEFIKSIIDRFYTMINEGEPPEQCASKKWK